MAAGSLKKRVEALEAEIASLKAKIERTNCDAMPWWEKIAGTFANDPIYEEAMRLGREWRESFRPKLTRHCERRTTYGCDTP
jgi:hypothetical protein